MPIIALVDDDNEVVSSTSMALQADGHRVVTYSNADSALDGLSESPADLVIMEVVNPGGSEILFRLRQNSDVPIILVTARQDEDAEVDGLKAGADDFIRKPFSQRVLTERIRAIFRRVNRRENGIILEPHSTTIQRGPLVLDSRTHGCTWKGIAVRLTVTEFAMLQVLASHPGVKSRDTLMELVITKAYVKQRTIDSHVKRLRKKFKAIEPEFDIVETITDVGYRLREL